MGRAQNADRACDIAVNDFARELQEAEQRYSGGITRVRRTKVSPLDPRLPPGMDADSIGGKMTSGARFIDETGYAEIYGRHLAGFSYGRSVLVELGVLLGVGIAAWCDMLPCSRIIGLDIEFRNFSFAALREKGAFDYNTPEVHFFDELAPDASKRLRNILRGERIDVMIDDALHDDASILTAMEAVLPFMAERFLYFVEDSSTADTAIRWRYPDFSVARHGRLTVVTND